jgi:hypothetical protein
VKDDDSDHPPPFSTEEFQSEFAGEFQKMSTLLTTYCMKTMQYGLAQEQPKWHLEKQVSKSQIKEEFFRRFSPLTFGKTDKNIIKESNVTDAINLSTLYKKVIELGSESYNKETESRKRVQAWVNSSEKGQKFLKVKSNIEMSLDIVYKKMAGGESRAPIGESKSINGSFTKGSFIKMAEYMEEHFNVNKNDIVCDAGCSSNCWTLHMAQVFGCKGFGIEFDNGRAFTAVNNFVEMMKSEKQITNKKVAYVCKDLMSLSSLGPTTILYMFDEAFTDRLMDHMLQLFTSTKSIRLILSVKQARRPTYAQKFEGYGWTAHGSIACTKYGCCGSNTITFYVRNKNKTENMVKISLPELHVSWDTEVQPSLDRVWKGTDMDIMKEYENCLAQIKSVYFNQKRK